MLISDLFSETFFSIFAHKARSALTMLGIVIGIGSVVAMISIGQGAQSSIEEQIQSIGSNLLTIQPGAQQSGMISSGRGSAQTLTQDDAEAIEEIASVQAVAPESSGRYQVTAKGTNTNTSVIGTVTFYPQVKNIEVENGSFISDRDVKVISKVAVLGPTTRDDLFGEEDALGKKIRINQIDFTVVGITQAKGGSGFGSADDVIYIPISTAQSYLSGNDYVDTINVQIENEKLMSSAEQEITALLLARHNISDSSEADFSIMSQADILETMTEVTNTFTIFLAAIASISLLVGGIGIMNMMLTTVTERIREIGLRKAIGAKRGEISLQFLIEAVTLTFVGGIIGIIVGCLISLGIGHFTDTATVITLWSIVLSFGVSALIGIAFGYYPAQKAASLSPIEALRYE